MEPVYLGLLSSLFNAIFKSIIEPVLKVVSSILEKIFTWIFDTILKPLLINFIIPVLKGFVQIIFEILAGLIYAIYALLLQIIDTVQAVFNVFAGIDDVTYAGQKTTVLELFFRLEYVQKTAIVIMAIGFVLMMAAAIVATIRSMGELGEQQRPVTKVLHSTFQGFIKLITIPLVCLFLLQLSNVLLRSIHQGIADAQRTAEVSAEQGSGRTTVARTLFVVSSLDAAKRADRNSATAPSGVEIGVNDDLRSAYYYGTKNYADTATVEKDFKYSKFNYIVGFGAGLILLYILALSVFKFINRVYNILILYIVAPFFAASHPLDDGEKFKAWKDLFVGQLFSAYGTVISMQVYLFIMPMVLSRKLGFGLSTEGDYVIRVLFLVGGAFAVKDAGPMITSLVDATSASMERQQDMAFFGAMYSAYSWGSTFKQAMQKNRNAEKWMKGMGFSKGKDGGWAFAGGKGGPGGGKGGGGGAAAKKGLAGKPGTLTNRKAIQAANKQAAHKKAAQAAGKPFKPGAAAKQAPKPAARYLGGLFTRTKGADGKMHTGFSLGKAFNISMGADGKQHLNMNLGKYFRFGMREDGTYKTNIFGFGATYDKDGNKTKMSCPFVRMTKDQNGGFQVSKVKISSGIQMRRAETVSTDADGNVTGRSLGNWYCSDFSPLNFHQAYDQQTGQVETLNSLFTNYGRIQKEDGSVEYGRTSSYDLLGRKTTYDRDAKGNEYVSEVDGIFTKDTYGIDKETGERVLTGRTGFGGRNLYEYDLGESNKETDPRFTPSTGAHFTISGEGKGSGGTGTGNGAGNDGIQPSGGAHFTIGGGADGNIGISPAGGAGFSIGGGNAGAPGGNNNGNNGG